jgi:hypothetical protein
MAFVSTAMSDSYHATAQLFFIEAEPEGDKGQIGQNFEDKEELDGTEKRAANY